MSVLDRFEKSVEGAVNGVFYKLSSKELRPVDLASALERELNSKAMPMGRDRTVAPNEFRFKLSTPDFDRIEQWGSETLANELADNELNEEQIHEEPQVEVTETVKVEQQAESKTISFEDLRAALANKARAGFTTEVKALIEKHGAAKLSDIDPSEYETVLAEAEVFGNA